MKHSMNYAVMLLPAMPKRGMHAHAPNETVDKTILNNLSRYYDIRTSNVYSKINQSPCYDSVGGVCAAYLESNLIIG